MKYLKAFGWRAVSRNEFVVTSDTAGVEYIIRIIGYKFQLRIRERDSSLAEPCIDFCRLHDVMQFAYEHYLKRNNF